MGGVFKVMKPFRVSYCSTNRYHVGCEVSDVVKCGNHYFHGSLSFSETSLSFDESVCQLLIEKFSFFSPLALFFLYFIPKESSLIFWKGIIIYLYIYIIYKKFFSVKKFFVKKFNFFSFSY